MRHVLCQSTLATLATVHLACLMLPQVARAEAVWEEDRDAGNWREIIHLTVTPADEPVPAFKHRLTLLPHEQVPGNSVAHYMRAFPEGGIEATWRRVREEHGEEVDEWYGKDIPISQLPLDKVREAAEPLQGLIDDYIAPGSRCRETDWGVSYVDMKGPEALTFLLPEIQAMRSVSRALALCTRLAIAEGRYDDALELMRVNYRLARDVGEQPILVSGLVGIAITGITNADIVDLIAAPNSPNLYWALSELPRPLVSTREAVRLELAIGPRMFEMLDAPETRQRTTAEWTEMWRRDVKTLYEMAQPGSNISSDALQQQALKLIPVAIGLASYSEAKQHLVERGYAADEVEAMAVGQVLAIAAARGYQQVADEFEKLNYFDYASRERIARNAEALSRGQSPAVGSLPEIFPAVSLLLPAVQAAKNAEVRVERDLDALRVIEALRMHAARNDGQWPATLDEVTCVPVPENPATGRPFEYRREGDKAILLLPAREGIPLERQYELTLQDANN